MDRIGGEILKRSDDLGVLLAREKEMVAEAAAETVRAGRILSSSPAKRRVMADVILNLSVSVDARTRRAPLGYLSDYALELSHRDSCVESVPPRIWQYRCA